MHKLIVIVGPTGVGKTKLSIELAKQLNGEIINADSTQMYRGLDIATAKVTTSEMQAIPHHLIDTLDINEDYTVFDYQRDARGIIDNLLKKNITPILVGGTGLYIKSVLYDYQFHTEAPGLTYDDLTDEAIYKLLKAVDPETNIHLNNRKRVIRALNYYNEHHIPFSSKTKDETLVYDAIIIGLTTTRDHLYGLINSRVDHMIDSGLLTEATHLYKTAKGFKAVLTPIGYKELFPYLNGDITLAEALNTIKQNSRHYAKRQYTWFKNQMDVEWFDVNFDSFDETIKEVMEYIKKKS